MSALAISVQGIGKHYRIAHAAAKTGRGRLRSAVAAPFDYVASAMRKSADDDILWAVKDISFDVRPGEVIGFIGLNGAGKSTLLKILSRITDPSEGRALIYGRVGTLLEVGTGFHPELTGRENIFLSGAILGMHRDEIERKFDEIVAFSEVERFLDMPVKRYSSGMYVRLAFAVAAHLEPEVLLVDEVLAVGDNSFQKRCLGKMGEVAQQGRTVLFVSHNMIAVQNLCNRVIWLQQGRLAHDGSPSEVIARYLSTSFVSRREQSWPDPASAPGNERVRLGRVELRQAIDTPASVIGTSSPLDIIVEFSNLMADARLHVCLHVLNEQHIIAFTTSSNETDAFTRDRPLPIGTYRSTCRIPGHLLNTGVHSISVLVLMNGAKIALRADGVLTFEVVEIEERAGAWYGKEPGIVRPRLSWSTRPLGPADADVTLATPFEPGRTPDKEDAAAAPVTPCGLGS
jgi:lipopolysaccharide transport system ATP-binding protein